MVFFQHFSFALCGKLDKYPPTHMSREQTRPKRVQNRYEPSTLLPQPSSAGVTDSTLGSHSSWPSSSPTAPVYPSEARIRNVSRLVAKKGRFPLELKRKREKNVENPSPPRYFPKQKRALLHFEGVIVYIIHLVFALKSPSRVVFTTVKWYTHPTKRVLKNLLKGMPATFTISTGVRYWLNPFLFSSLLPSGPFYTTPYFVILGKSSLLEENLTRFNNYFAIFQTKISPRCSY